MYTWAGAARAIRDATVNALETVRSLRELRDALLVSVFKSIRDLYTLSFYKTGDIRCSFRSRMGLAKFNSAVETD
jgi:hypothetical protein